jgi:hypothetical protein
MTFKLDPIGFRARHPDSRRAAAAGLACALALSACETTEPDVSETVGSVVVSPSAATVDVGGTVQLSAEVRNQLGEPITRSVSWNSADDGTATVNTSGRVTGQSVGVTSVTASSGDRSGTAQITVVDPTPPASPSGVQAAAVSNTTVQVSWNDESNNEDEFVIERQLASGSPPPFTEAGRVGSGTTSFEDTGLAPSTTYRYRVRACNAHGCSNPAGGSGASEVSTLATLVIETGALPVGSVGVAYGQQLEASGGDGSVDWSLAGGALPDGLTLSQAGAIGGTPTAGGTFEFTAQATGAGQSVTKELSIAIVSALAITTESLPTGITGVAYSQTLAAVGGTGAYLWTLVIPGLPSGFSLGATSGTIAGTPNAPSTSTFTVQASSGGLTATREFTIRIYAPLVINNTSLVVGKVGQAYNQQVTSGGGDGDYTWLLDSGQLPAGITLSTTGDGIALLSGTPTAAGSHAISLRVNSGDGQTAVRNYTLTINP